MLDLNKEYVCLYCGHKDTLSYFLQKKANGTYSLKMVKCDDCKERMKLNTLLANMSVYEWGLWLYLNIRVYNSPHNKFYERIDFHKLNYNLSKMGKYVTDEFWRGFKDGKSFNLKAKYKAHYVLSEMLEEMNKKYNISPSPTQKTKLEKYT